MIRGLAYRFLLLSFPYPWNVYISHVPSWIMFSEGRLKYIWYISSNIQFTNGTSQTVSAFNSQEYETHGTKMILSRLRVSANVVQCSDESSSISVYAGLLSWYLMKWRASPLSTVTCYRNQTANAIVVPHWYATVVFDISVLAEYADVNITIDTLQQYLARNITFKASSSNWSYTSFARASHILFSGFQVLGPQYTVPHQHMSIMHSTSLVTFQEAGTRFLYYQLNIV